MNLIIKIKKLLFCLFYKRKNAHIEKKNILNILPQNPVILDCGSHIGIDSLEFVSLNSKCTVHAIEPVSSIYAKLIDNCKNYNQIITYNIALSDKNIVDKIYISSGTSDGSSSLLQPKDHLIDHPDVIFDKTETIQCLTLDTWARENNVDKIDLLWLDMQGMELKMLKASEFIIEKVTAIHTEVSIRDTYEGVEKYEEVKKYLHEKGFIVKIEAIPNGWDMGNVLFVKKNL
jgi:FkbM family methyltransferase